MDAYGFGKSFCFSELATGHTRTSTVPDSGNSAATSTDADDRRLSRFPFPQDVSYLYPELTFYLVAIKHLRKRYTAGTMISGERSRMAKRSAELGL
jgi:hypothetical protein